MSAKEARPGFGLLAILLSAVGIAPLLNYGLSATSDLVIRDLGITESHSLDCWPPSVLDAQLSAMPCLDASLIGNQTLG